MFEKLTSYAIASFDLTAVGPVIVSSGVSNKTDPTLPDNTFLRGACGKEHDEVRFVIPGSTVKGVIRHHIEENIMLSEDESREIFGYITNGVQRSKIKFNDAYSVGNVVTSVRHSTAIDPVLQSAKHGSLNNIEVIEKGTFHGGFIFKNYTYPQMITVLRVFDDINTGEVKFGGRKSRGFGQMKVENFKMTVNNGYDSSLTAKEEKTYTSVQAAIEYFTSKE